MRRPRQRPAIWANLAMPPTAVDFITSPKAGAIYRPARRRPHGRRPSPGRQYLLQPPGLDDALEEGARPLLLGVAEDLVGRALLVDHAAIEEADLARDVAGKAHLVGSEQHGHAVLGEVAYDVEDLGDQLGVE